MPRLLFILTCFMGFCISLTPMDAATPQTHLVLWGQLNYDSQTDSTARFRNVKAILAGFDYTLELKNNGTVVSSGYSFSGQAMVPAGLSGVKAMEAGLSYIVALKDDGTVVTWGDNDYGQTMVPVGLTGVKAIAAGDSHIVALKNDGTVVAWGRNVNGQMTVPVGLNNVKAIAAGGYHIVALKKDGTVVAWGDNSWDQTTVPTGLSGVTAIAAGGLYTVALKNDGTVVAWGDYRWNQTTVPVGLSGVKAIAAGSHHSLALKGDGTVVAWGDVTASLVPADLSGVTSIAANDEQSVAFIKPQAAANVHIFPGDGTVTIGQGLMFVASIPSGTPPFTYQWRRNGVPIPKATNATLVLTNLQRSQEGVYDVVVKNAVGVALSNASRLSFPPLVPITAAPVDVDVNPAGTGSFSVDVPGATAWQWLRNGVVIRNATSSTLNVMNVDASSAGLYSVTVTTPAGKITTSPAQLRVNDTGLLIYKLTGTGTAYAGATATTGAVTGFLVLDRAGQRGGFLFNSKSGSQNIHRLEVHEDLNTQSTGPVPKTQTVVSELVGGEYSLWLNGTDGLLTVGKTDKAVGPATLKGHANSIDFGQTLRLETVSLTAALDALNSAPARLDGEALEQGLNRLSQDLQSKGSALVE